MVDSDEGDAGRLREILCPWCSGSGKHAITQETCSHCQGRKQMLALETSDDSLEDIAREEKELILDPASRVDPTTVYVLCDRCGRDDSKLEVETAQAYSPDFKYVCEYCVSVSHDLSRAHEQFSTLSRDFTDRTGKVRLEVFVPTFPAIYHEMVTTGDKTIAQAISESGILRSLRLDPASIYTFKELHLTHPPTFPVKNLYWRAVALVPYTQPDCGTANSPVRLDKQDKQGGVL